MTPEVIKPDEVEEVTKVDEKGDGPEETTDVSESVACKVRYLNYMCLTEYVDTSQIWITLALTNPEIVRGRGKLRMTHRSRSRR